MDIAFARQLENPANARFSVSGGWRYRQRAGGERSSVSGGRRYRQRGGAVKLWREPPVFRGGGRLKAPSNPGCREVMAGAAGISWRRKAQGSLQPGVPQSLGGGRREFVAEQAQGSPPTRGAAKLWRGPPGVRGGAGPKAPRNPGRRKVVAGAAGISWRAKALSPATWVAISAAGGGRVRFGVGWAAISAVGGRRVRFVSR